MRNTFGILGLALMAGIALTLVLSRYSDSWRPKTAPDPGAADIRPSPIHELMNKTYRGGPGRLAKALHEREVPWVEVARQSSELAGAADELGRMQPPRGEPDSWKRFTQQSADDAKLLATAAQRHDVEATRALHKKLSTSCNACHRAHR